MAPIPRPGRSPTPAAVIGTASGLAGINLGNYNPTTLHAVIINTSGGTIAGQVNGILTDGPTTIPNDSGGTISANGNDVLNLEGTGTVINYGVVANSLGTGVYLLGCHRVPDIYRRQPIGALPSLSSATLSPWRRPPGSRRITRRAWGATTRCSCRTAASASTTAMCMTSRWTARALCSRIRAFPASPAPQVSFRWLAAEQWRNEKSVDLHCSAIRAPGHRSDRCPALRSHGFVSSVTHHRGYSDGVGLQTTLA